MRAFWPVDLKALLSQLIFVEANHDEQCLRARDAGHARRENEPQLEIINPSRRP